MESNENKAGGNGDFRAISTRDVPSVAIDYLKPFAKGKGYSDSDAGVARFAIVRLAELLREDAM